MMKLCRTNITLISIICIAVLLCLLSFGLSNIAYADSVFGKDGTYEVPIKRNMFMGEDSFSDKVIVERYGDNYYMTFTVVKPDTIGNIKLKLEGEPGVIIRDEDGVRKYTYTISRENLGKELFFSGVVTEMNKLVDFSIELKLDKAKRISADIEDMGERPAMFVPVITTTASDVEMEKGSTYILPPATATMKGKPIDVSFKAYRMEDGKKVEVVIQDGKIKLEKSGEYHVDYIARSKDYASSFGNYAKTVHSITILSKIGATVLAKLGTNNDILPVNSVLQANIVSEGNVFALASNKMVKYADNFMVMNVGLFSELGEAIKPSGKIEILLRADDTIDRTKVEVFLLADDGTITKCDAHGYGRYVSVKTDKVGTFIICEPGVAFVMPMWGYPVIVMSVLLVVIIAVGVPLTIHFVRKKKAKALAESAESVHNDDESSVSDDNNADDNTDNIEDNIGNDISTSDDADNVDNIDKDQDIASCDDSVDSKADAMLPDDTASQNTDKSDDIID